MASLSWRAKAAAVAAGLALTAGLAARAQDTPASDATPNFFQAPPADQTVSTPAHRRAPAPAPAPPTPSAAPGARLAPGTPIPPVELEAFVDGVARQAMQEDHIPGAAVSVVQGGQVLLKKGYGFASYAAPTRAVDPDATLLRLGGLSSSFTWIVAMKEVERGHMRLDAPINLYLPEKLQVRDQGYADPVRLRDLMDHASGFEERSLGRLYERKPEGVRPLETYLREERPRRVRAPGLLSEYSDYDAALAGEAVSQETGQPFEALVEAEVLRPLGLAHTTFREPRPALPGLPAPMSPALAGQMAQGYRWTGLSLEPRPFAYAGQMAPAASASSTAADMARFMLLLLNGGTLDGQTVYGPTVAQAQRALLMRAAPGTNGWTHGLAQGRLPGGFDSFGLDGDGLSFHANMVVAPALGLGVFVAGDSQTARALTESLPGLIVAHFYAPPSPAPPMAAADPQALRQTYAGHYVSEQRRYGGLEQFVDLLTRTAVMRVDANGLLAIRGPEGAQAWAPAGQPGQFVSLSGDRTSAFQLKGGRAVRWFAPSGGQSFARVGWFMQPSGLARVGVLTLIASLATLLGLLARDRRDFRQTTIQSRASALQTTASVLWLLAALAFGVWGWRGLADTSNAAFDWPGGFILAASACALVAAIASLGQVLLLPAVWRGGRRLDSWSTPRKLTFTATVTVFVLFSAMLAAWGALEPWNN
jgi:CubicO group peptidase (beta-lactamase class C family)